MEMNIKLESTPGPVEAKAVRRTPRNIAPAPQPVPILAPKRKVDDSEGPTPLKKAKTESVENKSIVMLATTKKATTPKKATTRKKAGTTKKAATVKKETTVREEATVKKESTTKKATTAAKKKPTVKKETKATKAPKVVKAPKVKKARVVYKLPPEACIYLNNAMRGRVLRAMKQRMFVLSRELSPSDDTVENFEVLGSIGNSYTVTIGSVIKCTCMDYHIRQTHCKHILMVLLKVYRLDYGNRMFQSLNTSANARIQARSGGRIVDPSVLVPTKIREKILKLTTEVQEPTEPEISTERRSLDTSDCPICFEEFEQAEINSIDFCKVCGNNIHQECFNMWKASKGSNVTCVYCRSKWVFPRPQTIPTKKSVKSLDYNHRFEGTANFASELGLDRKRDTSTYKTYKGYSFED